MKKLVFLFVALLTNAVSLSAQTYPSIGIIGTAVNGWDADVDMVTTDGVMYTLSNYNLKAGDLKFRQDNDWIMNWGDVAFPIGTGTQGGSNIPVKEGNYNITFNIQTGGYYFGLNISTKVFLNGTAVDTQKEMSEGGIGFMPFQPNLFSIVTDVKTGTLHFEVLVGGDALYYLASDSFPSGIAEQTYNVEIPLTEGTYAILLDLTTKEYSFNATPTVSLSGTAIDGSNINLQQVDANGDYEAQEVVLKDKGTLAFSVFYYGTDALPPPMSVSTFPKGVAQGFDEQVLDLPAGIYTIQFNSKTNAYTFTEKHLGIGEFKINDSFAVFPNPVHDGVLYFSELADVTLFDISGRLVAQKNNTTSLQVAHLSKGIYVLKTSNGKSKKVVIE